jgi:hypothetical protein
MRKSDGGWRAFLHSGALLAALFLFAGSAAANVTVIASEVPGIEPKTELSDDMAITIGAGQSLTILLPSAATKTIIGPFDGQVRELYQNPGFISRLYRLIVDRWRNGSVDESQGIGARFLPPVFEGGWKAIRIRQFVSDAIYCYEAGTFPVIAREGGRTGDTLVIEAAGDGEPVTVEWPEASGTIYWPSGVQLDDNARFTLSNSSLVNTVTLRRVPSGSFSGNDIVAVLGEAGCTPQLAVWLEETSAKK